MNLDLLSGLFGAGGATMVLLSTWRLARARAVRGVHPWQPHYFLLWSTTNCMLFGRAQLLWSTFGAVLMTLANLAYLAAFTMYYRPDPETHG